MPNCFSYAVKGDLGDAYPAGYAAAYDTLNTVMGGIGGAAKNWQDSSDLLSKAMGGSFAQKNAGTTFLRTITGNPNLVYIKKSASHLGPTNQALVGVIVLGNYSTGGAHYFRRSLVGGNNEWRGVPFVGGTQANLVDYPNGTSMKFWQVLDNGQKKEGAVRGWWQNQ